MVFQLKLKVQKKKYEWITQGIRNVMQKKTRSLQACTKSSETPQAKKHILLNIIKNPKKNNNKELRSNTAGDLYQNVTKLANAFNNYLITITETKLESNENKKDDAFSIL